MLLCTGILMLFSMANVGLPGTSGFVGKFLVLMGAIRVNFWIGAAAALSLILSAAYTLWMYKRVMFGAIKNERVASLRDLGKREFVLFGAMAVLVLSIGLHPKTFTDLYRCDRPVGRKLLVGGARFVAARGRRRAVLQRESEDRHGTRAGLILLRHRAGRGGLRSSETNGEVTHFPVVFSWARVCALRARLCSYIAASASEIA